MSVVWLFEGAGAPQVPLEHLHREEADDFEPASRLPLPELSTLFNHAYEGYAFNVHVDERALSAFIRERSIDLDLSVVSRSHGHPVGLALSGRRGPRGYLAVLGVVPRARKGGHGRQLLKAAEQRLREAGTREGVLDVLEDNVPARRLYERSGYETKRALPCYRVGHPIASNVDLREVPVESALQGFRVNASWQTDAESIRHSGARAFGSESGVLIAKATPRGVIVYDVNGPDPGRVLDGLAAVFPDLPATFVNVPEGRLEEALRQRGWRRFAVQVEMGKRF